METSSTASVLAGIFQDFFFFFFFWGGGGNNLFRKISSSLTTEKMSFSLIEDLLKIRASALLCKIQIR